MQHASSILLPRVSRGLQRGREAQLVPLFCCNLAVLLRHASAHHVGRPAGQRTPPVATNCTLNALSPAPVASSQQPGHRQGACCCWRLPLFQPPVVAPQPPTGPVERSLKRQHTRVSRRGAVRWSLAGASSPPLGSPTTNPVRDSLLKSWRGTFCSACASQLGLPGPQWRCSTAQKNLVSRSVWAIRPTGSGGMLRRVPCG